MRLVLLSISVKQKLSNRSYPSHSFLIGLTIQLNAIYSLWLPSCSQMSSTGRSIRTWSAWFALALRRCVIQTSLRLRGDNRTFFSRVEKLRLKTWYPPAISFLGKIFASGHSPGRYHVLYGDLSLPYIVPALVDDAVPSEEFLLTDTAPRYVNSPSQNGRIISTDSSSRGRGFDRLSKKERANPNSYIPSIPFSGNANHIESGIGYMPDLVYRDNQHLFHRRDRWENTLTGEPISTLDSTR
ncbi:RING/U-box superfamily protein [Striga asiatica]|uniref:RING/U-box superfamily protein n=1 Tax=Striga asiatica TaxID=4170 RepID=A0A5A7Q016_STRAF|nr:RING/U-box superfamily protein [Striga asiatica]